MMDLAEEREFLLHKVLDNLANHGIPADETLRGSGASARVQRAVREHIEQMTAGVQR